MSLKIGAILEQPFSTYCAFDPECPQRGYGVDVAILVCRYLKLNCTFSWFHSDAYGDVLENGTVTGLVGAIAYGQFDTSLPVLTPTYRRSKAVSFSNLYFYTGVLLVTRAPSNEKFDRLSYAFQWPVWSCFILSFLITALLLTVIIRNGRLSKGETFSNVLTDQFLSLIHSEFNIKTTKLNLIKVIIIAWSSVSVVLMSAYTSLLCSQEVVQQNQMPFTDFETFVDCLVEDRCRLIVPTISSSITQLLQYPNSTYASDINNAIDRNPIEIFQEKDIPRRVLEEKRYHLVWPASQAVFSFGTQNNKECRYWTIDAPYKDYGSFAFRKNDQEMLTKFDWMAAQLRGTGLTEFIESKYYSNGSTAKECDQKWPSTRKQEFIRFSAMKSTFILWCIGMSIGLAGLIGEVCSGKYKKREKAKMRRRFMISASMVETTVT